MARKAVPETILETDRYIVTASRPLRSFVGPSEDMRYCAWTTGFRTIEEAVEEWLPRRNGHSRGAIKVSVPDVFAKEPLCSCTIGVLAVSLK